VPRSVSTAAVWLERACVPDDAIACRLLGVMKLQGMGLARDVERGKQMLTRACAAKDDEACRALKAAVEDAAPPSDDAGVGDAGAAQAPADAR